MKKVLLYALLLASATATAQIDRSEVLKRNNPVITKADTLAALSVGNGNIAFTVDITGMQSFPEYYSHGIPLTTMSAWGWHLMPNTKGLKPEDSQKATDTGNGHKPGMYAVEYKQRKNGKSDTPEQIAATAYFRENPHRLNLGAASLELFDIRGQRVSDINRLTGVKQELDLKTGIITSYFSLDNNDDYLTRVTTACAQDKDCQLVKIQSKALSRKGMRVALRFPYPTLKHSDDASDWNTEAGHSTTIIEKGDQTATIERKLDNTVYHIVITWEGEATLKKEGAHYITLTPSFVNQGELALKIEYKAVSPVIDYLANSRYYSKDTKASGNDYIVKTEGSKGKEKYNRPAAASNKPFDAELVEAAKEMEAFWKAGAFADFSQCTDPRAKEIERRVVLSQYLLKINEDTPQPPQEAGLTYNTWFGRPHMEMIWWHSLQWALWGKPQLLEKQMEWYKAMLPKAQELAQRQGYQGARWLKMTDPWGGEAPSNVGSFLIWQQPHPIYLLEELYRNANETERARLISKYSDVVEQTALFMADFATKGNDGKYHLKGCTGMQESLKWNEIYDPAFELNYWVYGLNTAMQWLSRAEKTDNALKQKAQDIIDNIAPIPYAEGRYIAANMLDNTQQATFFTNSIDDHPSVLGAYGLIPSYVTDEGKKIDKQKMQATFHWTLANWNWETTWGWDYGMTAMCAARLGMKEEAVTTLLMETQKNTYLPNGHNYQDGRLRVYLPGNGALLTAVAMMLAGWDGAPQTANPGFPDNGKWNVQWEGLKPMQ